MSKYQLSVLENANPKDYYVMIELMYTHDEQNMSKYLNYLAKSDKDQIEAFFYLLES